MSERIPVLQVVDSLILGGAERVALNVANALPRDRFDVHLCMTRHTGPLEGELDDDVPRLVLGRRTRLDEPRAVRTLNAYIRRHGIRLLHCHMDTIFLAALASLFGPHPPIVWHDHFGQFEIKTRPAWLYRLCLRRVAGVISVNQGLADWTTDEVGFDRERVWYLPNFVRTPEPGPAPADLPGEAGSRIVCVVNIRPQKDLVNLMRAMAEVVPRHPRAHALVVGEVYDEDYFAQVRAEVERLDLAKNVSFLGPRLDVPAVLRACDVGVLSSSSEGLPLTLIEYGMAALPVAVTRVGQVPEVVAGGEAGRLVPPSDPAALGAALDELLASEPLRADLGARLEARAHAEYGEAQAIERISSIYDTLLAGGRRA